MKQQLNPCRLQSTCIGLVKDFIHSDCCVDVENLVAHCEHMRLDRLLVHALNRGADRVVPYLVAQVLEVRGTCHGKHKAPQDAFVHMRMPLREERSAEIAEAVRSLIHFGLDESAFACETAEQTHWVRLIFGVSPKDLEGKVSGDEARDYCWTRQMIPM